MLISSNVTFRSFDTADLLFETVYSVIDVFNVEIRKGNTRFHDTSGWALFISFHIPSHECCCCLDLFVPGSLKPNIIDASLLGEPGSENIAQKLVTNFASNHTLNLKFVGRLNLVELNIWSFK